MGIDRQREKRIRQTGIAVRIAAGPPRAGEEKLGDSIAWIHAIHIDTLLNGLALHRKGGVGWNHLDVGVIRVEYFNRFGKVQPDTIVGDPGCPLRDHGCRVLDEPKAVQPEYLPQSILDRRHCNHAAGGKAKLDCPAMDPGHIQNQIDPF